MSNKRRTAGLKWEKVKANEVPMDIQNIVQLLLIGAKAQGCTCDPEITVPGDMGPVVDVVVAHDSDCDLLRERAAGQ